MNEEKNINELQQQIDKLRKKKEKLNQEYTSVLSKIEAVNELIGILQNSIIEKL